MRRKRSGTSIYDVAKAAGVSIATVSRAINGSAVVSEDIARKVSAAAATLGYVPERAAQGLSNGRSRMLAAIVPTLDYTIFARKVEAFRARAVERGYGLLLSTTNWSLDAEYEQCVDLIRSGAEGIMLEGGNHSPQLYARLEQNKIHYVNTSTYKPDGEHPTIGFRNRELGARATRHLLDLGHVAFGAVTGRRYNNDRTGERVEGISMALAERGLPPLQESRIVECGYDIHHSREAFRHLMALPEPPTAIVCTNDVLALGVLLEAQHSGIAIPGTVSVIGFDDLDWSAHLIPGLTTFYVPTAEIGTLGADYLVSRIEGATVVDHMELEVSLILRESTGPAPRRDVVLPRTAAAKARLGPSLET